MRRCKENKGFTLVELVVAALAAAIVLFAVSAVLITDLRVHARSLQDARERQSVQTVLALIEDLAAQGDVTVPAGGTALADGSGSTVLTYDSAVGTLCTGAGAVLLSGLEDVSFALNGDLLNVTITLDGEAPYETTLYVRPPVQGDGESLSPQAAIAAALGLDEKMAIADPATLGLTAEDPRTAFLSLLLSQYGSSGWIMDGGEGDYRYFSEWYIGGYKNGWDRDTPWCACFLSWAAAQRPGGGTEVPRFADVSRGADWFRERGLWAVSSVLPRPGDYIFFDWDGLGTPGHVGAVLYADPAENAVYTVEGNSGGRVALGRYDLDSPQIAGYGLLFAES